MASSEHLAILANGVEAWNEWRAAHPTIVPDLGKADLSHARLKAIDFHDANLQGAELHRTYFRRANLKGAHLGGTMLAKATLTKADLRGAVLRGARLRGAYLREADLRDADLSNANLENAILVQSKVDGAIFSGSYVYGVAAWDVEGTPRQQDGLRISRLSEFPITVDDLELAQFVYLILNNTKLRNAIDSVAKRGVLLLGRFAEGGLDVLGAIGSALRRAGYIPMKFDFSRPAGSSYTETVGTLVGLSRFVVADLSGPSVPHELAMLVPSHKIPFVLVLEKGRQPYSLASDIMEYPWVLQLPNQESKLARYGGILELTETIVPSAVERAEQACEQRRELLNKLYQ